MRSLLDVNVLIALLDPEHSRHNFIHEWWAQNVTAGWATCPLTQNGFVRITTQPSYPARLTPREALARLARETSRPDHEFWPDDISIVDGSLIDGERILGPNQITGIYLLALAIKRGGRFVTFDGTVSSAAVRGAEKKHCATP